MPDQDISVGDQFRSRARPHMVVTVRYLAPDREPDEDGWGRMEAYATVTRNTSRRQQSILVRRLLSGAYERVNR